MTDKPKDETRPRVRVGKLDSLGGVVKELGAVYREARTGRLDVKQASRLAAILGIIRTAIEGGEVERRLADLERTMR